MKSEIYSKIRLGNKGENTAIAAKIFALIICIGFVVVVVLGVFPFFTHMSCMEQITSKLEILEGVAYGMDSGTKNTELELPKCVKSIYKEDAENKYKGNICIQMTDGTIDCSHSPEVDGLIGTTEINYVGFDKIPRVVSRLIKDKYQVLIMPHIIQISDEELDISLTDNFYNFLKCVGSQCQLGCEDTGKFKMCKDYGIEDCLDCEERIWEFPYEFTFDLKESGITSRTNIQIIDDCKNMGETELDPAAEIIISKNLFKNSVSKCMIAKGPETEILEMNENLDEKLDEVLPGRILPATDLVCLFRYGSIITVKPEKSEEKQSASIFGAKRIYICDKDGY